MSEKDNKKSQEDDKKTPKTPLYDRLSIREGLSGRRMRHIKSIFKGFILNKSTSQKKRTSYGSLKNFWSAILPRNKFRKMISSTVDSSSSSDDPVADLEKYDYYHAHLSRVDAEDILLNVPVGHFLIRASKRTAITFAIILSIRTQQGISHFEIPMDDSGKFYFNDFGFTTVHELMLFHWKQRVPVSVIGRCELYLIKPVCKQSWEFDEGNVHLESTALAEGCFGAVYKGYVRMGKEKVQLAVKTLDNSTDEIGREELLREARIMRRLSHSSVLRCYGITISSQSTMVLFEFVNGGCLETYLRKNTLTPYVKMKLILSGAQGVAYIHKMEVLHRDLAARNFLVDLVDGKPRAIKVCDFGLSKDMTKVYTMTNAQNIPIRWSAPEVLDEQLWTQKSDVWSFGVVIWEVFSNAAVPYNELDSLKCEVLLEKLKTGYRLIPPASMPTDAIQLLNDIFNYYVTPRPSMEEIVRRLEQILEKMEPED